MQDEAFETMLTGGHHNSLGRTVEVFDTVMATPERLEEIYSCYFSQDEVVRLRTSSVFKRISIEEPEWLLPYIDKFINDIAKIDQASTQWTLAILFAALRQYMTPAQAKDAKQILQNNLANHNDWIVLNYTMQTLADWSKDDTVLKDWLMPHLQRVSNDSRKSVAGRAKKLIKAL